MARAARETQVSPDKSRVTRSSSRARKTIVDDEQTEAVKTKSPQQTTKQRQQQTTAPSSPTTKQVVNSETVKGPGGNLLNRRTTTTTVTTITVEEEENELPLIFPSPESAPIYRRASLFRSFVLADWLTCCNCMLGCASILLCLNYLANGNNVYYLHWAFICLPFALFFDIIDGAVARKQNSFSPFGSDLDSLSDLISFVICPVVIGFSLGLRQSLDCLALLFFCICGISRLARYNATLTSSSTKVPYYEGFPVPTSLIIDAVFLGLYWNDKVHDNLPFGVTYIFGKPFHMLSIMFIVFGALFVSASIRIPKP